MNRATPPAVRYRPMREADLDAVTAIEQQVHAFPWTRGNFADSLQTGYCCQVGESQDEVTGYGVLMRVMDEAHLLNLSIAEPLQGCGLGRQLLLHFIELARRQGVETLFLEVRRSNQRAIGLYLAMGFNEFSVRKGYYPAAGGREDALLMGLVL